jgi:hypothetical protein
MARGIIRVGTSDSSPSEPADSKPANARNPEVAASASAEMPIPGGSTNTDPDGRRPPGAVPAARCHQIAPMSTRIRQTDTTSNASTDRVVGRTPRTARTQMGLDLRFDRGQRAPYRHASGGRSLARRGGDKRAAPTPAPAPRFSSAMVDQPAERPHRHSSALKFILSQII